MQTWLTYDMGTDSVKTTFVTTTFTVTCSVSFRKLKTPSLRSTYKFVRSALMYANEHKLHPPRSYYYRRWNNIQEVSEIMTFPMGSQLKLILYWSFSDDLKPNLSNDVTDLRIWDTFICYCCYCYVRVSFKKCYKYN